MYESCRFTRYDDLERGLCIFRCCFSNTKNFEAEEFNHWLMVFSAINIEL